VVVFFAVIVAVRQIIVRLCGKKPEPKRSKHHSSRHSHRQSHRSEHASSDESGDAQQRRKRRKRSTVETGPKFTGIQTTRSQRSIIVPFAEPTVSSAQILDAVAHTIPAITDSANVFFRPRGDPPPTEDTENFYANMQTE
jgi:hypothetical protein